MPQHELVYIDNLAGMPMALRCWPDDQRQGHDLSWQLPIWLQATRKENL